MRAFLKSTIVKSLLADVITLAGGSFLLSMGKDYIRVLQKEKSKYGIQDSSIFSRFFNEIGLTSLAIS